MAVAGVRALILGLSVSTAIFTTLAVLGPGGQPADSVAATASVLEPPAFVGDHERALRQRRLEPVELGDCGVEAAELNRRLARLDYLPRALAGECFETATGHAVMALQKHEGIARDAAFGPQTARALGRAELPKAPAGGAASRIDISLSQQLAYAVRDGELARVISISSGAPGDETPSGTYEVFRKEQMSWSNPYSVWMPWASYFVGGIALHESADVPGYAASHGCVRVPEPLAEWLYGIASDGVQVRVLA